MSANGIRYKPPGPVAGKFFADRHRVSAINGPIGGGKTTAALMRMVFTSFQQQRSFRDGRRKFKLCVVRDTYRQLWKTTIPSWHKRFAAERGRWVGSKDAPALHELEFGPLPDGGFVDFAVEFVAIGENAAEDVLKGYEPTAFYINEADTLDEEVFQIARGRAGRYPDMDVGGPTWYGTVLDFNAPALGNWCYKTFYAKLPEDWSFYRQPSGLDPAAENTANLPPDYYRNQMSGQPDWYVDKFIRNKPGISRSGKPVYSEFNDALHVADHDLAAVDGLPLLIGLDAGGSPAGVIGQRMPDGQWRILDELVSEQGTGPTRFGDMLAKLLHDRYPQFGTRNPSPYLGHNREEGERYSRHGSIRAWADPSALYGADRVNDEMDWTEIVSSRIGLRVDAAPTNNPTARQEAVRVPLTRLIDGKPGFLLSPRCTVLRDGFNSGYRFKRVRSGGEEKFTEDVDKNEYSHPHDACQYVMSAGGEDLAIRDRKARGYQAMSGMRHVSDWDPFNVGA